MAHGHPKGGTLQPDTPWGVGMEKPALEPQRTQDWQAVGVGGPDYQVERGGTGVTDVNGEQPVQSSAPPVQPEETNELQQLRKDVGELTRSIGAMRKQHQMELEEARLMAEFSQAVQQSQQAPQIALPPGVDPDGDVKVKDLVGVLQNVIPRVQADAQAQAIRGGWDVTPEEEAQVLQKYPVASSYPEPDRTRFILRMAKLRRSPAQEQPAAETTPASVVTETLPEGTRQMPARTVPQPEASAAPAVPEGTQMNPAQRAMRAYETAEAMPQRTDAEKKERLAAMRRAYDELMAAQGMSVEDQKRQGFQQSA